MELRLTAWGLYIRVDSSAVIFISLLAKISIVLPLLSEQIYLTVNTSIANT